MEENLWNEDGVLPASLQIFLRKQSAKRSSPGVRAGTFNYNHVNNEENRR